MKFLKNSFLLLFLWPSFVFAENVSDLGAGVYVDVEVLEPEGFYIPNREIFYKDKTTSYRSLNEYFLTGAQLVKDEYCSDSELKQETNNQSSSPRLQFCKSLDFKDFKKVEDAKDVVNDYKKMRCNQVVFSNNSKEIDKKNCLSNPKELSIMEVVNHITKQSFVYTKPTNQDIDGYLGIFPDRDPSEKEDWVDRGSRVGGDNEFLYEPESGVSRPKSNVRTVD